MPSSNTALTLVERSPFIVLEARANFVLNFGAPSVRVGGENPDTDVQPKKKIRLEEIDWFVKAGDGFVADCLRLSFDCIENQLFFRKNLISLKIPFLIVTPIFSMISSFMYRTWESQRGSSTST
mgnify:CR=1 FL=1